jgi:acetyl esterase/lipase
MTTKADVDVMIKVTRLKASADAYLAGQDPRAPLASPIYADLKGLPPLFVHVGGREVLLDDATRLVDRARADGVDVTLEIEEEMIHVWHAFATLMPEADEGVRRVAEFLRSKLG